MAETLVRFRVLAAAFVTVTVASSVLCHPANDPRTNEQSVAENEKILQLFTNLAARAASRLVQLRNNEKPRYVPYEGTIVGEPQTWIFVPKTSAPVKRSKQKITSLTKDEERSSSHVEATPSRSENDTISKDLRDAPGKSSREEVGTVEGDPETKNDTDVVDVANRGLFGLSTKAHLSLPKVRAGGSFHLGISTQGAAKTKISARKEQRIGGKIEADTAETIGGGSFLRVSGEKRIESGPLLGDLRIKLGTAARQEGAVETNGEAEAGQVASVNLGLGHQSELRSQAEGKLAIHLEGENKKSLSDEDGKLVVNVEKSVYPKLKTLQGNMELSGGKVADGKIEKLGRNLEQGGELTVDLGQDHSRNVEKGGEATVSLREDRRGKVAEEELVVDLDQTRVGDLQKEDGSQEVNVELDGRTKESGKVSLNLEAKEEKSAKQDAKLEVDLEEEGLETNAPGYEELLISLGNKGEKTITVEENGKQAVGLDKVEALNVGASGKLGVNMGGDEDLEEKREKLNVNVKQDRGTSLENENGKNLTSTLGQDRVDVEDGKLVGIELREDGNTSLGKEGERLTVDVEKIDSTDVGVEGGNTKLNTGSKGETKVKQGTKLEENLQEKTREQEKLAVDMEEHTKTGKLNLENHSSSHVSANDSKKLDIESSDSRTSNDKGKVVVDLEVDEDAGSREGNEKLKVVLAPSSNVSGQNDSEAVKLWSGSGVMQVKNSYSGHDESKLEGLASLKKDVTTNDRKQKSSSKSVRTKVRSSSSSTSSSASSSRSKVNLGVKHEDAMSFGKLSSQLWNERVRSEGETKLRGVSTMHSTKKTESKKELSNVSGLLFLELGKTVGVKLKNGGAKMNVELESGDASSERNSGRNVNVALEHGEELDLGDLRGRLKVDLEGLSDLGSDHAGELVKVERNGGKVDIELKRGDEISLGKLRGKLNVNLGGALGLGNIGRRMNVAMEKEGESGTELAKVDLGEEDESKVQRSGGMRVDEDHHRVAVEKVSDMLDGVVMDHRGKEKLTEGSANGSKLGASGGNEGRKESSRVKGSSGSKKKSNGKRKSKRRRGKSQSGSSLTKLKQVEKTEDVAMAKIHEGDIKVKLVEPGTTMAPPTTTKEPGDQHFDGWSEEPELGQDRDWIADNAETTGFGMESDVDSGAKLTVKPDIEASPTLALDFGSVKGMEILPVNPESEEDFGTDYDEGYENSPLSDNDNWTEDSDAEERVDEAEGRVEASEERIEASEERLGTLEGRVEDLKSDEHIELQGSGKFDRSLEMGKKGDGGQVEDGTM